jgi:hypothetical protein
MSLRDGAFYATRRGYRRFVAKPNTDVFRLLTFLAAGRGRIYSRHELLWALRPGRPKTPLNIVNGATCALNERLVGTNLTVETGDRRGYRLIVGE